MGNLETLRWLFGHFSGFIVDDQAVQTACNDGRLDILQWLLDNEAETPGNGVQWNAAVDISVAVKNKQLGAARWLIEHIPIEDTDRFAVVTSAMVNGAVDIATLTLPEGRHVLEFVGRYLHHNVVELRLDSGHAIPFTDGELGPPRIMLEHLGCDEHWDLLQRVVRFGEQPDCNMSWSGVLQAACKLGRVTTLQWLLEQPRGQREVKILKSSGSLYTLLCEAAEGGNVEMLQYDQDLIDKYGNALLAAIRKDQMCSVKWILRRFPKTERVPDYCVLVEAAKFGRLDMLQYFETIALYGVFSRLKPNCNQTADMVVAKADHNLNVIDGQTVHRARWCSTGISKWPFEGDKMAKFSPAGALLICCHGLCRCKWTFGGGEMASRQQF